MDGYSGQRYFLIGLFAPPVQRRFEEHVLGLLGLAKVPGAGGGGGRGGGPLPVQPKKKTEGEGEGRNRPAAESEIVDVSTPEDEGQMNDAPLAAALRAKRGDLKPTEVC